MSNQAGRGRVLPQILFEREKTRKLSFGGEIKLAFFFLIFLYGKSSANLYALPKTNDGYINLLRICPLKLDLRHSRLINRSLRANIFTCDQCTRTDELLKYKIRINYYINIFANSSH